MSFGRVLWRSFAGVNYYWQKTDDGRYRVTAVQACDPLVDRSQAMATHNDGYSPSRELRRVASVPAVVRQLIWNTEGWDPWRPDLYPERYARFVNDPTWARLRTAPGRVGVSNGEVR